jgi:hypothetical protein
MKYAIQRTDSQQFLRGYGNAPGAVEWCQYPQDAINTDYHSAFSLVRGLRKIEFQEGMERGVAIDCSSLFEIVPVGEPILTYEEVMGTPFSDLNEFHAD